MEKKHQVSYSALSLLCSPIILMYALLGENGIIENYNARIQLLFYREISKVQSQNFTNTEMSNWLKQSESSTVLLPEKYNFKVLRNNLLCIYR